MTSSSPPLSAWEWAVVGVTAAAGVAVIMLLGVVVRFRKKKLLLAASPGLLVAALLGVLLGLPLAAAWPALRPAPAAACRVLPWLQHASFTIVYGAVTLKTWRISVIVRASPAAPRASPRSAVLLWRLLAAAALTAVYLAVWTVVLPPPPVWEAAVLQGCGLVWPELVLIGAELAVLGWAGFLCRQTRRAPGLYSDAGPVSFCLWNQALWTGFYAFSRVLLLRRPDPLMFSVLHAVYTHSTLTLTAGILMAPKLVALLASSRKRGRELCGTLTDVTGPRHIHRLALVLNSRGEVRTIHCRPCGPLYLDGGGAGDSESGETAGETTGGGKENHYTREEVDRLIAMVSTLRSERAQLSLHAQRLLNLLTAHSISLPPDMAGPLVQTPPSRTRTTCKNLVHINPAEDQVKHINNKDLTAEVKDVKSDLGRNKEESKQHIANSETNGEHLRKPSTVTTGVSSSSVSELGYGSLSQGSPNHFRGKHGTATTTPSPKHQVYCVSNGTPAVPSYGDRVLNSSGSSLVAPLKYTSSPPVNQQLLHVASLGNGGVVRNELIQRLSPAVADSVNRESSEFPQILNSSMDTLKGTSVGFGDKRRGREAVELVDIHKSPPSYYRRKVFLHQKQLDPNSDRASFILFI